MSHRASAGVRETMAHQGVTPNNRGERSAGEGFFKEGAFLKKKKICKNVKNQTSLGFSRAPGI